MLKAIVPMDWPEQQVHGRTWRLNLAKGYYEREIQPGVLQCLSFPSYFTDPGSSQRYVWIEEIEGGSPFERFLDQELGA